jgi:hypothetical protein
MSQVGMALAENNVIDLATALVTEASGIWRNSNKNYN